MDRTWLQFAQLIALRFNTVALANNSLKRHYIRNRNYPLYTVHRCVGQSFTRH